MSFCGNGNTDGLTAPLLGNKTVFGKLLKHLVGLGSGLIHLVYSNDN